VRVLIGCEYSGVERDAFLSRGHEAMSCDLLPTDVLGPHFQGDVFDVVADPLQFFSGPIDLAIFHPPCTHLSVSGARYHVAKRADGRLQAALAFVRDLLDADVPHLPPSEDRWKLRSLSYAGVAAAMADQWGDTEPDLLELITMGESA
jgi:hypothetical protein